MKEIKLSNSTLTAIVDDGDYDLVSGYHWSLHKNGHAHGWQGSGADRKLWVKMHSLIIPDAGGLVRDHVNHNKLDNRRSNLRLATKSQNAQNMVKIKSRSASKFKGVSRLKNGKWVAYIVKDYKQHHIGCFDTELAAATAYNSVAKQKFGDFACLNAITS